ncbi:MAG: hypothetical protein H7Y17_06550 [Chlorobia bacterium]|nr:hypothetical protein [Fimbriimonadaceae bacterium]
MKLAFVAGCVGFAILGISLGGNPFGFAALLVSVSFGIGAVIWWIAGLKKTDPYDLSQLQRVHEQEERRAIEDQLEQIDSAGNAICLNCSTHFDPMLNLCPRCGKSIYH